MKERDQEQDQQPLQPGDMWGFVDEPPYGYGPFDTFEACYELNGHTFRVEIQGFLTGDTDPFNNYRYRVTYEHGAVKILAYVIGTGFIEEGSLQTEHAKQLGICIDKHFSEEPNPFDYE
jgi:hypothetical protein